MKNSLLLLFVVLSVVEIVAEATMTQPVIHAVKPLLMLLLATWWALQDDPRRKWMVPALIFSLLGDIYLMPVMNIFLLGVIWFLCTHILYIAGMSRLAGWHKEDWLYFLPGAVFGASLLFYLWPDLPPGMRIPLSVYALGLVTMTARALALTIRSTGAPGFRLSLAGGAFLFLFSDCLIAWTKFGNTFAGYRVLIMSTYLLGQLLISTGLQATTAQLRHPQT